MKTTIDPPKTTIAKPALLSPSTSFFWILLAFAAPLPSIDGVAVRASSAFDQSSLKNTQEDMGNVLHLNSNTSAYKVAMPAEDIHVSGMGENDNSDSTPLLRSTLG